MLGKITTAAAVAALSITVLCADDFYRNDFSTRTSGKSLPGDRWMSYTYDPSNTLCYNYPYDSMAESMSPSVLWNSTAYQDSWAKVWIDSTYMRECPGFAVETDSVHGSSDNATVFDAEIAGRRTMVCRRPGRWKFVSAGSR